MVMTTHTLKYTKNNNPDRMIKGSRHIACFFICKSLYLRFKPTTMKNKILLVTFAAGSFLLSCKKETESQVTTAPITTYSSIKNADWFIGEWANKSAEGELTERWKKVNDSVYYGESYFVTLSKDTAFAETVQLEEANGKLAFTVTVPNQNNEKPVRFEATSFTKSQIVFENPKHDFPNKIVYNRVGKDSLVAQIYGTQKGKPATEKFKMKKVN